MFVCVLCDTQQRVCKRNVTRASADRLHTHNVAFVHCAPVGRPFHCKRCWRAMFILENILMADWQRRICAPNRLAVTEIGAARHRDVCKANQLAGVCLIERSRGLL